MRKLNSTMRSTTTKDLRSVPTIDLTEEELRERLRPIAEELTKKTWAKNGYLTYYDETLCPDNSYAIHEYRDRKELVRLENGQSRLVKLL